MEVINITGASQRVSVNGANEWSAVFECHKCGEEFAYSSNYRKSEKEAREESLTRFDIQQRRFCYRCGYKLTTYELAPESAYIATLNAKIDKLEKGNQELINENKRLRDCFKDCFYEELDAEDELFKLTGRKDEQRPTTLADFGTGE